MLNTCLSIKKKEVKRHFNKPNPHSLQKGLLDSPISPTLKTLKSENSEAATS
jgi:hypothetical protein